MILRSKGCPLVFCLFGVVLFYTYSRQCLVGVSANSKTNEGPRQQLQRQFTPALVEASLKKPIRWLEEGKEEDDADDDEYERNIGERSATRSLTEISVFQQQAQAQVKQQKEGPPPLSLDAFMPPSDLLRPFDDFDDFEEVDSAASFAPSEESTPDETNETIGFDLNTTIRDDNGAAPLVVFTDSPTASPRPSAMPTVSSSPTTTPSDMPSLVPSLSPAPSDQPSLAPSNQPSAVPSSSVAPSVSPSFRPSHLPSASPSSRPSSRPSLSAMPSSTPSDEPSLTPSESPSSMPSSSPSKAPSSLPSLRPTISPSSEPSSLPSSSPTLVCHDEPDYKSPINGFVCQDHVGTSCLQWRYLGLTLDSLENLIISCPVSCGIDCGTLTRFDITISYQISNVPGLLDALTVDALNSLTQDYLADFLRIQEPFLQFFIDEVELLSQSILSRSGKKNRVLAGEIVNLWVTSAIRGFAFGISPQKTTELLVSGIDSLGYTNSIQNSGNTNLEEAYAFSAAEKAADSVIPLIEDTPEEGNSASIALIVVAVIFACAGAFSMGVYVYHKRSPNGLPCCKCRQRRKVVDVREREVQSPESMGVASHVGSMFSFDDTATAGTNGLMRFISSFSRSRDSTSPNSSVQQSPSHETLDEAGPDEELAVIPSIDDDEDEDSVEDEPHPLTGLIPPMIVYDCIDEDEDDELAGQQKSLYPRQRNPSVVPSKCVEASSKFIAAIGNRNRPSATNDLAEYLSETSNFVTDPLSDPSTLRWKRLESRRPSPIGIVMDSDGDDDDDDDVSVASTPVRRQESISGQQAQRRTRSLDDFSVLESLSDIIFSEKDYSANISPIALPGLGKMVDSPLDDQGLMKPQAQAAAHVVPNDSPRAKGVSPDPSSEELASFTWVRGARTSASPETPSPWESPKTKTSNGIQEPRSSFWNRSPIAKGVKDAIWSKRVGTPTRPDAAAKRHGAPATPTRTDSSMKRGSINVPPSTPPRTDPAVRRASINGAPPSTTPTRTEFMRRSSSHLPPSTPTNRPEFSRRCSTPTRLEGFGRRQPTPTKGEPITWRNPSPTRTPMQSNSEESQGDSRRSLKSRSASFSTGQGSSDEEVYFEFRAPRIGKLGLVINSSPLTGPMVEQVKDYSTLFGCILAGDKIVEVDGVETSHMTIKEVTKRLTGKYGIRATSNEVKIKVARVREREWNDDDRRSVHSHGSASLDSFSSQHRRNHSDPEPLLDRLSLNSQSEQRLSSYSYSNHSKPGEEV